MSRFFVKEYDRITMV